MTDQQLNMTIFFWNLTNLTLTRLVQWHFQLRTCVEKHPKNEVCYRIIAKRLVQLELCDDIRRSSGVSKHKF